MSIDDVAGSTCQSLEPGRHGHHGRAVQVDPIKPTLKAPGM